MTLQRILLKLFTRGLLPGPGRALLRRRAWTIEAGEGAGLKLAFPQNLDFVRGSSEVPMQHALTQYLRPGGVFYDVGANIGFFSLLAARTVGPGGAVHSFEPVAENAAAVRRNAELNAFTNVSVHEVAAGESSAAGSLFVTEWDGGASLAREAIRTDEPVQRRAVRVVALDDIIASERLQPPSVVKIDVEGAELGVLRGMLKTLVAFRPVVIYEVDDGDRASFERRRADLDAFVSAIGYRVSHLPDSYPNVNWHVGHSLALPHASPRAS